MVYWGDGVWPWFNEHITSLGVCFAGLGKIRLGLERPHKGLELQMDCCSHSRKKIYLNEIILQQTAKSCAVLTLITLGLYEYMISWVDSTGFPAGTASEKHLRGKIVANREHSQQGVRKSEWNDTMYTKKWYYQPHKCCPPNKFTGTWWKDRHFADKEVNTDEGTKIGSQYGRSVASQDRGARLTKNIFLFKKLFL